MRFLAAIILALATAAPASSPFAQRVALRTDDGVTLGATWYEPSSHPAPAVVLVHMLGRNRHDWEGLASRLASEGIGALAIDLRGHGESQGAPSDLAPMVQDVRAARRFVTSRPDAGGRIGIVGASLGATLAVLAASDDAAVSSIALLSPSLDYRGLRMDAAARKYGTRPMLLVASDDDGYALRSSRDLKKGAETRREILTLSHAGHGTRMLTENADLTQALVDWFRRTLL
jgi:alpha-beta hydrolase superfamily lysophospholipase